MTLSVCTDIDSNASLLLWGKGSAGKGGKKGCFSFSWMQCPRTVWVYVDSKCWRTGVLTYHSLEPWHLVALACHWSGQKGKLPGKKMAAGSSPLSRVLRKSLPLGWAAGVTGSQVHREVVFFLGTMAAFLVVSHSKADGAWVMISENGMDLQFRMEGG